LVDELEDEVHCEVDLGGGVAQVVDHHVQEELRIVQFVQNVLTVQFRQDYRS
jgi:hypothetical protein